MRTSLSVLALAAAVATVVGLTQTSFAQGAPANPQYKKLKDIAIGGANNWDYLRADPENHRLYIAHQTKVEVIDTAEDKKIGEITNTPGVHGVAIANDLKRAFTSNGQGNNVSIIDLESKDDAGKPTFKLIGELVKTGPNPDAIMYDEKSGEVWTSNGGRNNYSATVIDAKTGKVLVDAIPLGGKPETGAIDPEAKRAYINIENKNEVVEVDQKEHKVLNHWPIAPADGPTGLVLVPDLHRLVVGASKMVLMDSTNGKVVATLDCGNGVDAAAYDPGTHLAFVSAGGNGTVTVAKVEADKLTLVQTLTTERGARTMTVDTKTHKIYLANGGAGGFKVMVFGIEEKP